MPSNRIRTSMLILVLIILWLVPPTSLGNVYAVQGAPSFKDLVQAMLDQVDPASVYTLTGDLSGAWETSINGQPYTIYTRHALRDRKSVV